MEIRGGDRIVFGADWCVEYGREHLIGKEYRIEIAWFEVDNGMYVYESCALGIPDFEGDEAYCIHMLFGTYYEYFMDCKLVTGNTEYDGRCEADRIHRM